MAGSYRHPNTATHKRCHVCKEMKSREEFYVDMNGNNSSRCRPCNIEYGKNNTVNVSIPKRYADKLKGIAQGMGISERTLARQLITDFVEAQGGS